MSHREQNNSSYGSNKRAHSLETPQQEKRSQPREFNLAHLVSQELRTSPEPTPGEKRPEERARKLALSTQTNLTITTVRNQLYPITEVLTACSMLLTRPLNQRTVENLANHWRSINSGLVLIKATNLFNTVLSILKYLQKFGNPRSNKEHFLGAISGELNADIKGPLNKILEDEYLDQSDEQILSHLKEIEKQHIVVLTHSRMALDSFEAMIPDVNQIIRTGLPSAGLSTSENKKNQVQIITEKFNFIHKSNRKTIFKIRIRESSILFRENLIN